MTIATFLSGRNLEKSTYNRFLNIPSFFNRKETEKIIAHNADCHCQSLHEYKREIENDFFVIGEPREYDLKS